MSVSASVDFPAQPTDGFYRLARLGGNGMRDPFIEAVGDLEVVGDASGGQASLIMNLDPVYSWLVNHVQVRIEGETADVDSVIRISAGGPVGAGDSDIMQSVVVAKFGDVASTGNTNFGWYTPAPMILDPTDDAGNVTATDRDMQIQVVFANAGATRTYRARVRLLGFSKGAKFETPLSQLYSSLSRGSTISLN